MLGGSTVTYTITDGGEWEEGTAQWEKKPARIIPTATTTTAINPVREYDDVRTMWQMDTTVFNAVRFMRECTIQRKSDWARNGVLISLRHDPTGTETQQVLVYMDAMQDAHDKDAVLAPLVMKMAAELQVLVAAFRALEV